MSQIRRTNQGGSIVLVIIVGVLVVLGLIGGIYLLKQRGEQARLDQATAAANQQIAAENAKKTAATVAASNSAANAATRSTAASAATANIRTDNEEDLPVTGPESSALELIGIGALTAFVVGYLRSRRTLACSL
jgi:cytoskeletal protein RodZ